MDRTFLIHAGMPKTGSTAIQAALNGLRTPTHEYLDLGRANHSHLLHAAFSDAPSTQLRTDGVDAAAFEAGREEARGILHKALERARARNVMLSAEYISRFDVGELTALREALRPHGACNRVIAYVRPPLSRAESSVQQALKQGTYVRLGIPTWPGRTWRRLREVFGADQVELLPFRKDLLSNGDVVRDLCERWGLEHPEAGPGRSNRSLSLEACALLLAQNRQGRFRTGRPGSNFAYARLADLLAGFGDRRLRLHAEVMSSHAGAIRESYAEVAGTLRADLYDLDRPAAGDAIRSEDELLMVAASLEGALRDHLSRIDLPEDAVPPAALQAARSAPGAGDDAVGNMVERLDAFLFAARVHWAATGRSARGELAAGRGALAAREPKDRPRRGWKALRRMVFGARG